MESCNTNLSGSPVEPVVVAFQIKLKKEAFCCLKWFNVKKSNFNDNRQGNVAGHNVGCSWRKNSPKFLSLHLFIWDASRVEDFNHRSMNLTHNNNKKRPTPKQKWQTKNIIIIISGYIELSRKVKIVVWMKSFTNR